MTPVSARLAGAGTAGGSVPWRMGVELGRLRECGIDLEPNVASDSANVIVALAGGEVTIAEGGSRRRWRCSRRASPSSSFPAARSSQPTTSSADRVLKSLRDIKAVAEIRPGSLTNRVTATMVRNQGSDSDKLQVISIGSSNDDYASVVARKIDAGIGDIALLLTADRDGVKPLVKAREKLSDHLSACIFCMADTLQSQRDVIVRTLAGFARSYQPSRQQAAKDSWIIVAGAQLHEDQQQAEFGYQWMRDSGGIACNLELPPSAILYLQEQNIHGDTHDTSVPCERTANTSIARDALAVLKGG